MRASTALVALVGAALLAASCEERSQKADAPLPMLCAAEALHRARASGVPLAEQDVMRQRAELFYEKLPPENQQNGWQEVDLLSDRRGAQPLANSAACEALLTAADRKSLRDFAASRAEAQIGAPARKQ